MILTDHFIVVFSIMFGVTIFLGIYGICVKYCKCCRETPDSAPAAEGVAERIKLSELTNGVSNEQKQEKKKADGEKSGDEELNDSADEELEKLMATSDEPESLSTASNPRFDIPLRPSAPLGHYSRRCSTPSTSGMSSGYNTPSTQDAEAPDNRLQVWQKMFDDSMANPSRNMSEASGNRPRLPSTLAGSDSQLESKVIDMEMTPLIPEAFSMTPPEFRDHRAKTYSMSTVVSFGIPSESSSLSLNESSSSEDLVAKFQRMRCSGPFVRSKANMITTAAMVHVPPPSLEQLPTPPLVVSPIGSNQEDIDIDLSDYHPVNIPKFDFQRRWSLGV